MTYTCQHACPFLPPVCATQFPSLAMSSFSPSSLLFPLHYLTSSSLNWEVPASTGSPLELHNPRPLFKMTLSTYGNYSLPICLLHDWLIIAFSMPHNRLTTNVHYLTEVCQIISEVEVRVMILPCTIIKGKLKTEKDWELIWINPNCWKTLEVPFSGYSLKINSFFFF